VGVSEFVVDLEIGNGFKTLPCRGDPSGQPEQEGPIPSGIRDPVYEPLPRRKTPPFKIGRL